MDTIIAFSGNSYEKIVQEKDPGNHENGVHGARILHYQIDIIKVSIDIFKKSIDLIIKSNDIFFISIAHN